MSGLRRFTAIGALVLTAACASVTSDRSSPGAAARVASVEAETAPAHAPRPFTPEQIRAATPTGAVREYRTKKVGAPSVVHRTTVAASSADAATFVSTTLDSGGNPVGAAQRSTATWSELVAHATFPAGVTTVEEVVVETPAGRFDATLYTVLAPDADGGRIKRFYFAKALPGAPVRFEHEEAGEVTMRVELVSASTIEP